MPSRRSPDALVGLAPVASTQCPLCGQSTLWLANGRGRLGLCQACGTLDVSTVDGLEMFSMRDPLLPRLAPAREGARVEAGSRPSR